MIHKNTAKSVTNDDFMGFKTFPQNVTNLGLFIEKSSNKVCLKYKIILFKIFYSKVNLIIKIIKKFLNEKIVHLCST